MEDFSGVPTEKEILSAWDLKSDLKVTVVCFSYNHVSYIEKCISSILKQKTSFRFEILIHDDASTDGTIDLIKKYYANYPSIIRLKINKINKFSKIGSKMTADLISSIETNYFAICECDDYWLDEKKLQFQYDLLESNKNISISIHNALKYNVNDGSSCNFNSMKLPDFLDSKDIIIRSWFSPTASFFIRNARLQYGEVDGLNMDMVMLFRQSLLGNISYTDKIMSVYNYNSEGSLSSSTNKTALLDKKINFYKYAYKYKKRLFFHIFLKVVFYKIKYFMR